MKTLAEIEAELSERHPESQPIDHRGWRFTTPFHCFRCGIQIPAYQFAFACACGGCDVGNSPTARLHPTARKAFAGPHEQIGTPDDEWFISPEWLDPKDRDKFPVLRRPEIHR